MADYTAFPLRIDIGAELFEPAGVEGDFGNPTMIEIGMELGTPAISITSAASGIPVLLEMGFELGRPLGRATTSVGTGPGGTDVVYQPIVSGGAAYQQRVIGVRWNEQSKRYEVTLEGLKKTKVAA